MKRKENENNIIYSCKEHGLDNYRKIKNNPNVPKTHVYAYFPAVKLTDGKKVTEKMWIRIVEGDRNSGMGILDNEPIYNRDYKIFQFVRFETDENDITKAM